MLNYGSQEDKDNSFIKERNLLIQCMFISGADRDKISATRSFAEGDYGDFGWKSIQSIEKYCKAILLYHGVSVKKDFGNHKPRNPINKVAELEPSLKAVLDQKHQPPANDPFEIFIIELLQGKSSVDDYITYANMKFGAHTRYNEMAFSVNWSTLSRFIVLTDELRSICQSRDKSIGNMRQSNNRYVSRTTVNDIFALARKSSSSAHWVGCPLGVDVVPHISKICDRIAPNEFSFANDVVCEIQARAKKKNKKPKVLSTMERGSWINEVFLSYYDGGYDYFYHPCLEVALWAVDNVKLSEPTIKQMARQADVFFNLVRLSEKSKIAKNVGYKRSDYMQVLHDRCHKKLKTKCHLR